MAVLMREAIGESLRRARTARRRTLRDVSRKARVSLGYLSEVERGRKEPSSELLAAICDALGLALHELLSEAAEAMAADALLEAALDATRSRRPVGLRHMDLQLAGPGETTPLTGAPGTAVPAVRPLGPPPPALPARPTARVRVAA